MVFQSVVRFPLFCSFWRCVGDISAFDLSAVGKTVRVFVEVGKNVTAASKVRSVIWTPLSVCHRCWYSLELSASFQHLILFPPQPTPV